MNKDFDEWNKIKKKTDFHKNTFIPRAGEVCLCSLSINIGFESNGKNHNFVRPVLIIKSYKKSGAVVLPLTSKYKEDIFHFKLNTKSFIKLTQIKFVDIKRFKRRLYKIDSDLLTKIRNQLFEVI
jgi:mRNA interferase MazF